MTWSAESLRRDEFPFAGDGIYLNAASIGPLPQRTLRAMEHCLRSRAAPFTLTDDQLGPILQNARVAAAALLGADPSEIALTTNTSYGINLAAGMLPLHAGDHVVVSAGEFPANVFPWQHLSRRGVVLELVPVTAEGWPDEEAMRARVADPRVRALAVSHVQYHTGYRVDLDRLSAACRESGTWLVVDSIQALGAVPFDVRRTPVDILCCGAQKWLLGPWGAGFLYVRREHIPTLVPATVGWLSFEGTEDFSRLRYDGALHSDARRFEMITLPFQDLLGMTRSLELLAELGIESVWRHLQAVQAPVLDWARRHGVRLASPGGDRGSGMLCLAPADPGATMQRLQAAGVMCSLREGAIRLSPHCYTTREEMERVVEVLGGGR